LNDAGDLRALADRIHDSLQVDGILKLASNVEIREALPHYNVGSVRFTKDGWIRGVYFPLLFTHTILAALIVPMVLRTVYLAFAHRFSQHSRLARYTFPTWLYVSVTGVIVYFMLYQL